MNLVWEPIIAAILAITSFSIKANPKAPAAAAVLEHVVDEADLVVHVDWQPTVADNYATFTKLPDDAVIKQVPELHDAMRQAISQVEGGRSMAKAIAGLDPVNDLTSMTGFVKFRPGGQDPEFLIVVRGKFPADLATKIARTAGGKESTVDGRAAATLPDGTMFGVSKSGAFIGGKGAWVQPRIKDSWKASARPKGSAWGRIATVLDTKPFMLIASKPSADALALMTKELEPSFGRDLVTGHELGVFSATSTGIGWVFQARDAGFASRMKLASEGAIAMLRAAHVAPRGMAQLAFAALPSYARTSKGLDAVLASKDKLMNAMWDMTGDGKFDAKVKLDGTVVTVTTRAKRISEVVPVSMVVGLGAIGFVTSLEKTSSSAPASQRSTSGSSAKPSTSKPAPRPSGIGGPAKAPAKPAPRPN